MKKIVILTHSFPFGEGETFIDQEAQSWDTATGFEVSWCPNFAIGPIRYSLVSSVLVQRSRIIKLWHSLINFPLAAFKFEMGWLRKDASSGRYERFKLLVLHSLLAGARLGQLRSLPRFDLYYAYWCTWDALVAQMMGSKLKSHSIVRSHGNDLYEGVAVEYIPFRRYLSTPSGAPSRHVYLADSARQFAEKRFGTTPFLIAPLGISLTEPLPEKSVREKASDRPVGPYTFVSASHFTAEKRLEKLGGVLRLLWNRGLLEKWVHLGGTPVDGSPLANLLTGGFGDVTQMKGLMPNHLLRRELEELRGAVFINLSSTEGMPVTVMEAMAAGLPVIASDVGAVSDMFPRNAGLLVEPGLGDQELSEAIERWLMANRPDASGLLAKAHAFEFFSAEKNHRLFIEKIKSLLELE